MTHFRISVVTSLTLLSGAGALLAQSGPAVATLVRTEGVVYLRAGERMMLNRRAGDMIPVMSFSPAELDEFDRWSRQHATAGVR